MEPNDSPEASELLREHGGADVHGVPTIDFSTNANACGPAPIALAVVRAADAEHYPDPSYAQLVAGLAARHAVAPERIVLAASASEAIFRLTASVVRDQPGAGQKGVWIPACAYGDYAAAAHAWRLPVVQGRDRMKTAALAWLCDPASPTGVSAPERAAWAQTTGTRALDCAYVPLQLGDASVKESPFSEDAWQVWTPNKALGLTGVRGAYLIAPDAASAAGLAELAPSWPIGTHGVAMLQAWCRSDVQDWLSASRATLAIWKVGQMKACRALGWVCEPSITNFYVARPAWPEGRFLTAEEIGTALAALRRRGVKLRNALSLGRPGWVRMAVLPPSSVHAFVDAWHGVCEAHRLEERR